MDKFWEDETPETALFASNALNYYPKAGKLTVSRCRAMEYGLPRPVKNVVFDVTALLSGSMEAMETTRFIFEDITAKIDNVLGKASGK